MCVVQDLDLLAGQSVHATVYAVPAANTQCSQYQFTTQRTCQQDRTFSQSTYYDACTTLALSRDSNGCSQVPGYVLLPGLVYAQAEEALYDDGTLWDQLPATARAAAAGDAVLMAARCSLSSSCAGFDSTGNAGLRAYVPLPTRMTTTNGSLGACSGTYVRQFAAGTACPRISGYLYAPGVTWGSAGGDSSEATSLCAGALCSNTTAMAAACDKDTSCTGFSHMHGLRTAGSGANGSFSSFTATPCRGMYSRVAAVLPPEVEVLDQLMCGDSSYCAVPLQYTASVVGSSVSSAAAAGSDAALDVTITIGATMQTPPRLLDPSEGTIAGLPSLPRVSRLQIVCTNGSKLVGGLPRYLLRVLPKLSQLVLAGCGIQDMLPAGEAAVCITRFGVIVGCAGRSTKGLGVQWLTGAGFPAGSWNGSRLLLMAASCTSMSGPWPRIVDMAHSWG